MQCLLEKRLTAANTRMRLKSILRAAEVIPHLSS